MLILGCVVFGIFCPDLHLKLEGVIACLDENPQMKILQFIENIKHHYSTL